MVICPVVGCCNRTCLNTNFFRIPKTIKHQCDRTKELSEKRWDLWRAGIRRAVLNTDRTDIRVCGAHFENGKPVAYAACTHLLFGPPCTTTMGQLISKLTCVTFVGRPSKLWGEADPDWALTLLLGYSSKQGDCARHDRSVR